MRKHTVAKVTWDEGQMRAAEDVSGMVDQLIIDRCIMEEMKQYHRNLAVAFYDYKKAYVKVHHDLMIRVHKKNLLLITEQNLASFYILKN